jgi:hypothetical protein
MKKEVLLIFILLVSISFSTALTCPLGFINDTYPGSCGKYIDRNSNDICDLSEETIVKNAPITENKIDFIKTINGRYYSIPIIILSTIIYLISYFLVKKQKISLIMHRKIWNVLLLISFIIVALTSLAYILQFDYGISTIAFTTINFWHIEIGIAMIMISIFHAAWHISYYKSMLPTKVQ